MPPAKHNLLFVMLDCLSLSSGSGHCVPLLCSHTMFIYTMCSQLSYFSGDSSLENEHEFCLGVIKEIDSFQTLHWVQAEHENLYTGEQGTKEDRRVKVEEQCSENNAQPLSFFLLCVTSMKGTGYWKDLMIEKVCIIK